MKETRAEALLRWGFYKSTRDMEDYLRGRRVLWAGLGLVQLPDETQTRLDIFDAKAFAMQKERYR